MDIDTAIKYTEMNRERFVISERLIMDSLEKLNINFIFQYPIIIKHKLYIVDFYLPELYIYIEVDGNTHDSIEAKKYDKIRKIALEKELKAKEIRIKNKWCYNINLKKLLKLNNKPKPIERPITAKYKYLTKKHGRLKIFEKYKYAEL